MLDVISANYMSKLKQIREQQNLTQKEVSEKSKISIRTIQRIESGTEPKGHTLKALSQALNVPENELITKLDENSFEENFQQTIENLENKESENKEKENEYEIDFQKVKLINLSSILFIIFPPLNSLVPYILFRILKQNNHLTKQIVSLQIFWTISSAIVFMLGVLLKLGNSFTLIILVLIVLSNIYLILRNLAEIDRKKKLYYKLNFNMI